MSAFDWVLTIVIIALVVGAGWYLWHAYRPAQLPPGPGGKGDGGSGR